MENLLTLLTGQFRRVHRLAQHFDRHTTCLLQVALFLVVLLQQALRACIVCAHARSLPSAVIPTWITLVKLELSLWVVASIYEGNAKRSETTVLRVALFQITQTPDKLLARNVFIVGKEVALGSLTSVVDENVGVSGHTSDGTNHITTDILELHSQRFGKSGLLIQDVELFSRGILFEELAGDLSFRGQDDAILGQYSESGTGM